MVGDERDRGGLGSRSDAEYVCSGVPPALAIRDASTALGPVLEAVEHAHHTSKG